MESQKSIEDTKNINARDSNNENSIILMRNIP